MLFSEKLEILEKGTEILQVFSDAPFHVLWGIDRLDERGLHQVSFNPMSDFFRDLGIKDMSKWHFISNSRIIWLFPPSCSEGSHIAPSLIQETSSKHVARIGPLGLIFCLLLLALVPKAFAAPQTGQIVEHIDVTGNRKSPPKR